MTGKTAFATLAMALLLPACDRTPVRAPPADPPMRTAGEPETPAAPPAAVPVLTPEAERGEKGARNLLLAFARDIEQAKYDAAWALLSPTDQRKWSLAEFAALFADLGKVTVAVPTGTIEGAAGSSYYGAPVTITGSDPQGRPVRIEGKAVLRRVNEVEGATPAQLRWHFDSLALDWTH
jgi:hypothetical protein